MTKIEKYLEEHKEEFKPWLEDHQQGRVEIKILPFLQDIEDGVFIEAGALDGLFMANTKILEDLGWTGLLVEPSLQAAKLCSFNRKGPTVWGALVSLDYPLPYVEGDFLFDGNLGSGAWSSIGRNHYEAPLVGAPAIPLAGLLSQIGFKKVDLLSLDVEGYELEVLKGVDWEKNEISYILVEVNIREYSLETMDTFLAERGYKNLGCLSNFSYESNPGWDGSHNDYLYGQSR